MIVGAGTVTSTDSVVLQLFRNRSSAAAPASADTSPLLAPLHSLPASRSTASDALARIQELVKGGASGASREQEAIARVKSWVASGNAADAAAGRDSAWLQQMARDGQLGDLPPLTREQEDTLTRAELRVYVEARHWQAYYDAQPKTLAQAQADYVAMKKETLPDTIRRMSAALASGQVPDELAGAWKTHIADMESELQAVRSGRVKFELADPAFNIGPQRPEFVRDGQGLVIGGQGGGGSGVNWDAIRAAYGDGNVTYGTSEYFGGYVITW